jgi:hypothetical protein
MKTPFIVTAVICILLLCFHFYFDTLGPSARHVRHSSAAQDNPVLTALKAAASGDTSSRSLAQQRDDAVHNKTCCSIGPIPGVLAAAAAFQKASNSQKAADSMQAARELMLAFRPHLAKPWAEALQPVVAANTQADSSCQCRSVEILPAHPSSSNDSTALLLVIKSWSRLVDHSLNIYSANLLMMWFYARLHGYGLHIYVHGADLPPWMPVYFIKPAGLLHVMKNLGYQNIMYVDWDMLLSPHTAPPLSLFYGEYPQASLLVQGEYNLEAGANLWRNTAEGRTFLQAWWDLGAKGCCPTTQHDQSAFKHLILAYLASFTGDASLYGPARQRYFKLPDKLPPPPAQHPGDGPFAVHSTEAPPTVASTWLQLRPVLKQRGSAVGLVGLDVHYPR